AEAAEEDAAEVALRIARAEQGDGVLGGPGEPVEVALVAGAVGGEVAGQAFGAVFVVGADVEQAVEAEEGLVELGAGLGQVAGGLAEVVEIGGRDPGERTDLFAQDRLALPE